MFIAGIISLVQILFLPGYIILKLSKISFNFKTQTTIFSFGLSLFVNYLLVITLVVLGFYITPVVWAFIVVEIIALLIILNKEKSISHRLKSINNLITNKLLFLKKNLTFPIALLFVVSLFLIVIYLSISIANSGSIFDVADDIFSWNRWANELSDNHLPSNTMEYPQLIPANWSLTYVITGTKVQFFAKSIMPLFIIINLLIFFNLWETSNKKVYLIALVIYSLTIVFFHNYYILAGYVDIAFSCMSFIAFFAMMKAEEKPTLTNFLFVLVFSCAACVTKQAGFFILGVLGLWSLIWAIRNKLLKPDKNFIKILIIGLVAISTTIFWYIYKTWQFKHGYDHSILSLVATGEFNSETTRLMTALHAFKLMGNFLWIFGILIFFSLFNKISRLYTLFINTPFVFLWAFFFSYDLRNLSLIIPLCCLSAAFGLITIYELIKPFQKNVLLTTSQEIQIKFNYVPTLIAIVALFSILLGFIFSITETETLLLKTISIYSKRSANNYRVLNIYNILREALFLSGSIFLSLLFLKSIKLKYLILSVALILITLNFTIFRSEKLHAIHYEHEKYVFTPDLNIFIYKLKETSGIKGKIGTNHGGLHWLPELKDYSFFINHYTDMQTINQLLENKDVKYLLLRTSFTSYDKHDPLVFDYLDQMVKSQKWKILYRYERDYVFLEIN